MSTFSGACFGGPADGRMVANDTPTLLAAMPPRLSAYRLYAAGDDIGPSVRTVRYDWQRVAYRGDFYGCWVANGYPTERIIDGMNAIAVLAALPLRWGVS